MPVTNAGIDRGPNRPVSLLEATFFTPIRPVSHILDGFVTATPPGSTPKLEPNAIPPIFSTPRYLIVQENKTYISAWRKRLFKMAGYYTRIRHVPLPRQVPFPQQVRLPRQVPLTPDDIPNAPVASAVMTGHKDHPSTPIYGPKKTVVQLFVTEEMKKLFPNGIN